MNKNDYINLVLLLILSLALVGLINYLSKPEQEILSFSQCKLDVWESCNLTINEDTSEMCYKINGTNDTKWEDCPEATQDQADCWLFGYYLDCVDPFEQILECFLEKTNLEINESCKSCQTQINILNNFVSDFEKRHYSSYFNITYSDTSKVKWHINNKTYNVLSINQLKEITGC